MRYLDVDMSFAADSALSGAAAGNIYLELYLGGKCYTMQFNEYKGWKQTLEIKDELVDIDLYGSVDMVLKNVDRDGYAYSYASELFADDDNIDDSDKEPFVGQASATGGPYHVFSNGVDRSKYLIRVFNNYTRIPRAAVSPLSTTTTSTFLPMP